MEKGNKGRMVMGIPYEEYFASGHRACSGCGEAVVIRHVMKAAGPNTIAVMATGCMEVISTPYPETAWKVPWIHVAFENNSAVASGIDAALKTQGKREGVNLLVLGGDGASFDIGFGALSGAIERGHKFTYVCTDNEAYMNTGVQRSGATPFLANTTTSPAGSKVHGKQEPKKPLPLIVASHGARYVATASPANILDLHRKMKKALGAEGPSFILAYSPCPTGWYIAGENSIEIARLAIQTRIFPVYEIENGVLKFTQKVEKEAAKPVKEYLQMQGRFKHLSAEEVERIQKYVDERYEFLLGIEGKKCFDVLF
ncbi:MAG: pyruvate synthase subunit PorB [Candidatus Diapherotrites archaeon]|nr:pyruvate synthase subunit PorB [Candidatus Diapherotrites archaeon]